MNIGKFLKAKIQAHSGLDALIGGRIYPVVVPQKGAKETRTVYPAIVFITTPAPADASKNQPATTDRVQVNFHIWADTYETLEDIDVALRDCLDYQTGTAGGVTVTGAMYAGSAPEGMDEKLEYFVRESRYDFRILRT